jgi:two-component system chemotaxis response regulator CheY
MYSILIVDDSEIIRTVLEKTLKIAKVPLFGIFQAENGNAAMEILENEWVDLVLTDLNMPVMSGFELIDKMYSRKDFSIIPVVVISTEGSAVKIDELRSKGIRGYLRKPFTPELVCTLLKDVLGDWNE